MALGNEKDRSSCLINFGPGRKSFFETLSDADRRKYDRLIISGAVTLPDLAKIMGCNMKTLQRRKRKLMDHVHNASTSTNDFIRQEAQEGLKWALDRGKETYEIAKGAVTPITKGGEVVTQTVRERDPETGEGVDRIQPVVLESPDLGAMTAAIAEVHRLTRTAAEMAGDLGAVAVEREKERIARENGGTPGVGQFQFQHQHLHLMVMPKMEGVAGVEGGGGVGGIDGVGEASGMEGMERVVESRLLLPEAPVIPSE